MDGAAEPDSQRPSQPRIKGCIYNARVSLNGCLLLPAHGMPGAFTNSEQRRAVKEPGTYQSHTSGNRAPFPAYPARVMFLILNGLFLSSLLNPFYFTSAQ